MTQYCVLKIADYRLLYLGNNRDEAIAANVSGTHLATADRLGDCMCRATMAVGYLLRGVQPPAV